MEKYFLDLTNMFLNLENIRKPFPDRSSRIKLNERSFLVPSTTESDSNQKLDS